MDDQRLAAARSDELQQIVRVQTDALGLCQWMEVDLLGAKQRAVDNNRHQSIRVVEQAQRSQGARSDAEQFDHLLARREAQPAAGSD